MRGHSVPQVTAACGGDLRGADLRVSLKRVFAGSFWVPDSKQSLVSGMAGFAFAGDLCKGLAKAGLV